MIFKWLPTPAGLFVAGNSDSTVLILILLTLILGVYLWNKSYHHKEDHAERLQKTYRILSRELLNSVPDEELVNAVIANLMGKLDKLRPDDYKAITVLSRGRCAVYSVWLTCHELKTDGLLTYLRGPSGRFAELAADGLELVGAAESAEALCAVRNLDLSDEEKLSFAEGQLMNAITREKPLELCCDYIRTNPDEFVDDKDAQKEDTAEV